MKNTGRSAGRIIVACLLGLVFGLPILSLGIAYTYSWALTKTTDRFYVECPYLSVGGAFALVGLFGLASCVGWAIRRVSNVVVFAAVLVNLVCMHTIGGEGPLHREAAAQTANFLNKVREAAERWHDSQGRFPASEAELRKALQENAVADSALPNSAYSRTSERLRYEVVVVNGATGPRTDGLSVRPAVVYYCVSTDQRQFWATITVLPSDLARASTLLRRNFLEPDDSPWVVQSREVPVSEKR